MKYEDFRRSFVCFLLSLDGSLSLALFLNSSCPPREERANSCLFRSVLQLRILGLLGLCWPRLLEAVPLIFVVFQHLFSSADSLHRYARQCSFLSGSQGFCKVPELGGVRAVHLYIISLWGWVELIGNIPRCFCYLLFILYDLGFCWTVVCIEDYGIRTGLFASIIV